MKLSGPHTYQIAFSNEKITSVKDSDGNETKFLSPVTQAVPKLYVISDVGKPIYVGATRQPIRSRLTYGFKASGEHGYRGYQWRHHLAQATMDIWVQNEGDKGANSFIETVEAEVVFLIRQEYDQWPEHQIEIHFHPSEPIHRELAGEIVKHYRSPQCPTG